MKAAAEEDAQKASAPATTPPMGIAE